MGDEETDSQGRRIEDRLTDELKAMEDRLVARIIFWQDEHVKTRHLGKTQVEIQEAWDNQSRMITESESNGVKLDMIIDDYFGNAVADIDGETHRSGGNRDVVRGIAADVAGLKLRSENGGIPAKVQFTTAQKAALWIVGVGSATSVLIALIQAIT